MNRLDTSKRTQILAALVEGNSIRATCRMTGAAKGTVLKLLADIGPICSDYQDRTLRNLPRTKLQCDEIWSYCGAKARNVKPEKKGEFGFGDVWTWTAICADTKLVPSYFVGDRSAESGYQFMSDLASRLTQRVQLSTDGHSAYLTAVYGAFQYHIDYAQIVKMYGQTPSNTPQTRYSPAHCTGTMKQVISGKPNKDQISTSYVERQNLTMRMSMRRFTRLTNGFSKKVENLSHAVSLHFMHYNFCRKHQTLKTTPAVAAGVADHIWTIGELVSLLEGVEETEFFAVASN